MKHKIKGAKDMNLTLEDLIEKYKIKLTEAMKKIEKEPMEALISASVARRY